MAIPDCNKEMREIGAAIVSRTCERCGLGPCSRLGEPLPPNTATFIRVDAAPPAPAPAPDVPGDEAYPWANGDTAILLRSFIFEQLSTPQSTLEFKKEIPAMAAFLTWIMTGSEPSAPSGSSKLKVVQP